MRLILGTMTIGESVFRPEADELVGAFLDAGHDELDTAYVYNGGECERILGELMPALGRPVRVSTKVNPRVTGRLDGDAARMQLEESLRRLGLERVDTVFLHFPDPATPLESALSAMAEMHEEGKFRELGLSNFPAWMVADAWHACEKRGWVRPTVYQGVYNPLTRGAEAELDACLSHFGLRFWAYNPTMGGMLAGRYASVDEVPGDGRFAHRPGYRGKYWKRGNFDAIALIGDALAPHGIGMAEATYRWLAHHSMLDEGRGDAILVGASRLGHLVENMRAAEAGPLPADVVEAFDAAWGLCRGCSREYFTLYAGRGSVGGEAPREGGM